ncbi:hypothetical protein [Pseudotamlana haliotis]|nr:hypothetical protein [Tamlana haliotis]
MKILKITLIVAVFIALFTSCIEASLNEDEVLVDNTTNVLYRDGNIGER